jgi:hypothetical protein
MRTIWNARSCLRPAVWLAPALVWLLATGVAGMSSAGAQDAQDAKKVLKAMADYVAGQKGFSFDFDSTIDLVTPSLQKIQFASSGQVLLSRPDKLRATRTGGYADVELVFDGKAATLYGRNLNAFAQVDAPGSIDQLVDRLRANLDVDMPGADLLLSNVYEELTADVVDAKHIGRGVIEGAECEHLAFRNDDVDWQIWIEVGSKPLPRKYIITTNAVTGGPQYTLVTRNWKTDLQTSADAFAFKPMMDARRVDITALAGLDEVPHGTPAGGKR